MNRKLAALIALVMSLMLVFACAFAEDWFCPDCGKKNEGNFCYNCGHKKPDGAGSDVGISNVSCSFQDNGDILVTWNDQNNIAPYTVEYRSQFDASVMDPVNTKRIILAHLIPSVTYTITVSNGKSKASTEYTVPVRIFTEFTSSAKKIVLVDTNFSISEVEKNKTKHYELQFHYPQLRKDRTYKGKLVTKTPLGYGGYVWVYDPFEMGSQYSYIYADFSMHEFFEGIKHDFDEIPRGQYTFEMYFDGQLYASCTFNVVR